MNDLEFECGRVVMSKAGRDRGRYFIIIKKVDTQYVLIADGVLRKVNKPKKKKIKHLLIRNGLADDILEKISNNEKLFDSDIKKSLESLGYNKINHNGKET